jgi:hypothetical protein
MGSILHTYRDVHLVDFIRQQERCHGPQISIPANCFAQSRAIPGCQLPRSSSPNSVSLCFFVHVSSFKSSRAQIPPRSRQQSKLH